MSRVKARDTKPELAIRSLLHAMGYRFRLHNKNLPGKPDIVLPKHRRIVFVHGCFWHGHKGCRRAARPASNVEFWNAKLDSNIKRDNESLKALEQLGWKCLVIWQCELHQESVIRNRLKQFMKSNHDEQKKHECTRQN